MKSFNILGVHWKIRPLGGIAWKGGLGRKKGGLKGGSYPNAHYGKIVSWEFERKIFIVL